MEFLGAPSAPVFSISARRTPLKVFPASRLLTLAGILAVLSGIPPIRAVEPAPPGIEYAQHGDLNCGCFFLGFQTFPYVTEPGIWGALLITKDQVAQLNAAWAETAGKFRGENKQALGTNEELKQGDADFKVRRDEILTDDQKELVRTINAIGREMLDEQGAAAEKLNSSDMRAKFNERIAPLLTEEQRQNLATIAAEAKPNSNN